MALKYRYPFTGICMILKKRIVIFILTFCNNTIQYNISLKTTLCSLETALFPGCREKLSLSAVECRHI